MTASVFLASDFDDSPSRRYFLPCIPQEYRAGDEMFGAHWHVVVSRDEINANGRIAIVVPLTFPENKETGLPKDAGAFRKHRIRVPQHQKTWDADAPKTHTGESIAKTEQLFCISREHFRDVKRCGRLNAGAPTAIEAGMAYVLKIPLPGLPVGPLRPPLKA